MAAHTNDPRGVHPAAEGAGPAMGASWRSRHVGGDLDANPADAIYEREAYTSTKLVSNAPVSRCFPVAAESWKF